MEIQKITQKIKQKSSEPKLHDFLGFQIFIFQGDTVDGSEIRRSPVEVGRSSQVGFRLGVFASTFGFTFGFTERQDCKVSVTFYPDRNDEI